MASANTIVILLICKDAARFVTAGWNISWLPFFFFGEEERAVLVESIKRRWATRSIGRLSRLKEAGNKAFSAGNFEEAYERFTEAVRLDSGSALLRSNRAGALASRDGVRGSRGVRSTCPGCASSGG